MDGQMAVSSDAAAYQLVMLEPRNLFIALRHRINRPSVSLERSPAHILQCQETECGENGVRCYSSANEVRVADGDECESTDERRAADDGGQVCTEHAAAAAAHRHKTVHIAHRKKALEILHSLCFCEAGGPSAPQQQQNGTFLGGAEWAVEMDR